MKTILTAVLLLAAISAHADYAAPNLSQQIFTDSVTVYNIQLSSGYFVPVDTPKLRGSFNIVVQSTDTTNFCCGFEAGVSTQTAPGTTGCIQGQKEAGLGFFTLTLNRWYQNLNLSCISLQTAIGNKIVRVLQGR